MVFATCAKVTNQLPPIASNKLNCSDMSSNFVYFRNVDYYSSEEELSGFLSEFKLVSVIIPNHTVAFRSNKRRPLGIAYAEFEDADEAQKVAKAMNGSLFHGRVLSARVHSPFVAKQEGDEVEKEVSLDTLYIPHLRFKVEDKNVREFFRDYNPQKIYIFTEKKNSKPRMFGGYPKSGLITLQTDSPMEEIIKDLNGKKICHKSVLVKRAYIEKIERVVAADEKRKQAEAAAAAAAASKEGDQQEEDADEETSIAAPEVGLEPIELTDESTAVDSAPKTPDPTSKAEATVSENKENAQREVIGTDT